MTDPLAECKHEMLLSTCDYCRPCDTTRAVATGPTIVAAFDSHCAHCDDEVEEGDSITLTDDGWALTSHTTRAVPDRPTRYDVDLT